MSKKEWIKVDKNEGGAIVEELDLWLYNDITDEVEFYGKDDFIPLGRYTHYMICEKPSRPNIESAKGVDDKKQEDK